MTAPFQHWRPDVEQQTAAFVVVEDLVLKWDRSEVPVTRGQIVHVRPGSELWRAYGGEAGLRPVHGGQALP